MKFKTHPILTDLKINEDGTSIFWKDKSLKIHSYKKKGRDNYPAKLVNFNNFTHRVTKLICEAWNGMAEDIDQVVKRRDLRPTNDHYTNLYWGNRGGYRTKKTKRAKTSKISEAQVGKIVDLISTGEKSLRTIAQMYGTSEMSIYRIKFRYFTNKKMLLKERIMKARDNYDIRYAYARFLGYENIGAAIDALGRKLFIIECKNIIL